MENKKFYSLKYDQVFKNVFFRDINLLKYFLTNILNLFYDDFYIDDIEIKNTELSKDRLYIKNKCLDILVKTGNKIINLEINTSYNSYTKNRNLIYLFNSIIDDTHKSDKYTLDNEHIQINFNFNDSGYDIESYHILEDTTNKLFTNVFRIININVDYFYNEWYNLSKDNSFFKKYKNIIIMNFNEDELLNLKDCDKFMDKIKNDITSLNKDDDFYQFMTDEEDQRRMLNSLVDDSFEKGVNQGITQGINKANVDNAKKMIIEKVDINIISKVTGLSIDEINKLKISNS